MWQFPTIFVIIRIINYTIGSDANLKKIRIEMGVTQKHLAKMMGVTQVYISRIENGDIEGLTMRNFLKLAKILKVSPFQLLELLLEQYKKYKRR
ncbi:Helix-turn-helix [Anaerovirgula multivorans]|uniref:Helix-turn-helix n=1 Tax=Anaerovirgula multivorans TaxID=312168 RepID=A0A238ZQ19_9FIRM|nr:helix-turn-helix transcriptional regulator [Anaerovirgula multivorans]SNR85465.1 Helix-turn-helix [Anaerovirgula multivorans]